MDKERLAILFERYFSNTITADELRELSTGIRDTKQEAVLDEFLQNAYNDPTLAKENEPAQQAVLQNLLSVIQHEKSGQPMARRSIAFVWRRAAAIAAILLLSLSLYLFYTPGKRQQSFTAPQYAEDISPGSNKATLTLANGAKLILGDSITGRLANEAGVQVSKSKNGEIIYTVSGHEATGKGPIQYNILSTVKKEQYQIVLADGSHVWLNASSSLKYPVSFTGRERKVELTGEAYFEIAHNASMPFIVKTATQEVEVLGTHFNINAYADEPVTKTTLLEGSVRVHSLSAPALTKTLEPAQQAINDGNNLTIHHVDTEESVAWKNGYFVFNEEDLGSVMRKLSRWYDVEVVYSDSSQIKQLFAGSITRYAQVSKVLSMLEKAGNIHFTINGQQIIIDK